ncbi:hypothetical protein OCAE111667_21590 [Occultella aeris]
MRSHGSGRADLALVQHHVREVPEGLGAALGGGAGLVGGGFAHDRFQSGAHVLAEFEGQEPGHVVAVHGPVDVQELTAGRGPVGLVGGVGVDDRDEVIDQPTQVFRGPCGGVVQEELLDRLHPTNSTASASSAGTARGIGTVGGARSGADALDGLGLSDRPGLSGRLGLSGRPGLSGDLGVSGGFGGGGFGRVRAAVGGVGGGGGVLQAIDRGWGRGGLEQDLGLLDADLPGPQPFAGRGQAVA